MKRLTSNNTFEMNMTELALNQVFVEKGWAWYTKAPGDDCSVCDLIRSAAIKGLKLEDIELDSNLTDEELGDIMLDWLQFGETEPEGILAILYRALWAMAELRERLKLYEDICFAMDGTELLTPELLRKIRADLKDDPLTEEQLREMDEGPLWIGGEGLNRWDIFVGVSPAGDACFLRAALPMESCGKTWAPYRRKPENHANEE